MRDSQAGFFHSVHTIFYIALHQFGASAFAQSRTPLPSVISIFGTVLAQEKRQGREGRNAVLIAAGELSPTPLQSVLPALYWRDFSNSFVRSWCRGDIDLNGCGKRHRHFIRLKKQAAALGFHLMPIARVP